MAKGGVEKRKKAERQRNNIPFACRRMSALLSGALQILDRADDGTHSRTHTHTLTALTLNEETPNRGLCGERKRNDPTVCVSLSLCVCLSVYECMLPFVGSRAHAKWSKNRGKHEA